MPPAGGYAAVQYKRNLPARGFRPAVYLGAMALVMGYGFWVYGRGMREAKYVMAPSASFRWNALGAGTPMLLTVRTSELAREKMWARIHLIPLLQAEEDRDQVRRHLADQAREEELLGSRTKVYNSDR